MMRSTRAGRGLAVAGAVALALTACSSGSDDAGSGSTGGGEGGVLHIGTLLPVTGSLSQLGPPEIAGVDLAVKEINDAGGVFGEDVKVTHTDSSDSKNASVGTASAQQLISEGVSAVIGAASSSVTLNVVDDITGAGIVQVSPANTADALSGYSDFYFRTAPPDTVQGGVLGNLVISDGASNVGVLVFNDSYGTGLRDTVASVIEDGGGTIVYGSDGQEFDPDETNFSSIVADALAAEPDAIVLITFTDQSPPLVRELAAQGWDMSKVYFVDGNLDTFGTDGEKGFPEGTLQDAQGTLPGAYPSEEFQARMLEVDPGLENYSYGPESYDATMLVALAALRGGASDGQTIRDNMAAVSGADGGTECTGWEECKALVEDGEDIAYQAVSGIGPFNEANDPASAFIGIYQFGPDNLYTFTRSEEGEVQDSAS